MRGIFSAELMILVFIAAISQAQTTAPSRQHLPAPREVGRLGGETGGIVVFSLDGLKILTADRSVQLWDGRTLQPIGNPLDGCGCVYAQFDHSAKKLLSNAPQIGGNIVINAACR